MDSIQCVFITSKDFEAVVEFTRNQFLQDEPLCHSLNLKDEFGLDDYFRNSIEQGTSVMAVDTANGNKIVGVRAHRVQRRDEQVEENNHEEGDPCAPLLQLVDFAFQRYNPWTKLGIEKLLYFKFLSVHRDYRGRGVSAKMMEFTFDFMRRERIPVAYVLASSAFSQAVFRKAGFQLVDEMRYEDYKVDGKRVFQPKDEVHNGWATLIKWIQ